jgi:hypothetical protein
MGTTAAFLDMKAAYNNVLKDILHEKLKNVGVPPNVRALRALVWNPGSKRVLHFKYGALDVVRVTHRTLPQGTMLSPIMYVHRRTRRHPASMLQGD